jgi:hypothetical protein
VTVRKKYSNLQVHDHHTLAFTRYVCPSFFAVFAVCFSLAVCLTCVFRGSIDHEVAGGDANIN